MLSDHPEELLRSALEKIVFFECRVEQLEAELSAARAVAERARAEAGAARGREVELERALAGARGDRDAALSQNRELFERVRLLEAERERLLTSMVEQSRVSNAPVAGGAGEGEGPAENGPDLAGFIAELRSEIEQLRPWKAAAEAAGMSPEGSRPRSGEEQRGRPVLGLPELAGHFGESGRLGLSEKDAVRMKELFATRSERALYEVSMGDLASADREARRRAAGCLRALGSKAAAPIVAAALGREADPEVKSDLLRLISELGGAGAAELSARELSASSPAVRAAALEAVARLEGPAAEPRLLAALADASPLVRRRAALLLGYRATSSAEEGLAAALSDRDPGVARAAAAALSGRPSAGAQRALAKALEHPESAVRRTAARAVSRWAGEVVDDTAPAAQRRQAARRIAGKLAEIAPESLRAAVLAGAGAGLGSAARHDAAHPGDPLAARGELTPSEAPALARAPIPRATSSSRGPGAPRDFQAPGRGGQGPAIGGVASEGSESPRGSPLDEEILAELRAALRGRSAAELTSALGAEPAAVEGALSSLAARGTLTRRGPRFFTS